MWRVIFLFCFVVTAKAVPRPSAVEELRALILFPTLESPLLAKLEPASGFPVLRELPDFVKEIEEVRKQLKGGPDDAERHVRLARLYELQGDQAKRRASLERAHTLFQQRLDRQQNDALLMTLDGAVLRALNRSREAEARLREATVLASGEWECWLGLGRFCKSAAFEQVAGIQLERVENGYLATLHRALELRPNPIRLDRAADYLREGRKAFQQALETIPDDQKEALALVRIERGLFFALDESLSLGLAQVRGDEIQPHKLQSALYGPKVLSEFRAAGRIRPVEPQVLGSLVLVEAGAAIHEGKDSDRNPSLLKEPWNFLPLSTRERIQELMMELDLQSESPDPTIATAALWTLSILQQELLRDGKGAQSTLQRAAELKPESGRVFERYCATLNANRSFPELLVYAEERLKSKPLVIAHIYAARALEGMREFDMAYDHLEAALQTQPNDFLANLALAAVAMEKEDWQWHVGRVQEALTKAGRALGTSAARDKWIELAVAESIFLGLQEKPDGARRLLKTVLKLAPEHERAKAILAIIGH